MRSKFELGRLVYLITDPEQLEYIVTGIHFRPTGVSYSISNNGSEFHVYDIEISKDKDVVKSLL